VVDQGLCEILLVREETHRLFGLTGGLSWHSMVALGTQWSFLALNGRSWHLMVVLGI
jgi:hypothetical protein